MDENHLDLYWVLNTSRMENIIGSMELDSEKVASPIWFTTSTFTNLSNRIRKQIRYNEKNKVIGDYEYFEKLFNLIPDS